MVLANVCFVGYVMDTFCIQRGALLDKPTLTSLEHPQDHSIHCLVDVERCRSSGYEVLQDPRMGSETHCRVYELDSAGNAMVLQLARQQGSRSLGCSTCGSSGTQRQGFRATVKGTINPEQSGVPTLTTTSVDLESVGCGGNLTVPQFENCVGNENRPFILAHGACMLTAWALLLPLGVIIAHFLRRLAPLWFKIHRALQITGLCIALVGFLIAVSTFNVFQANYPAANVAHGTFGLITMILGVSQPINAYFRPHKEKGHPVTKYRRRWEYLHKGSGYTAVVLGPITAAIGTTLAAGDSIYFQIMFGVAMATLIAVTGYLVFQNRRHCSQQAEIHRNEIPLSKGAPESK